MKNAEYIARNLRGFEGDTFIKAKFEQLRDKFNINTVIETGTYLGGTTKVLSTMFKKVITVELNDEYWIKSNEYLRGLPNVLTVKGSSDEVIDGLLEYNKGLKETVLFWLDAHWEKDCPLLRELAAIAKHKIKPVIVIHDWKVPNRPDLGYDSYNGQDFEFSWIESGLNAIYGEGGYKYEYNDQAEGAKRGVIYIYPI